MKRVDKARQFRAAGILAAQNASDNQALSMHSLYDEWATDKAYGGEGQSRIVRRGEQLYRCRQSHTSQTGWEPENYPAGWVAINKANAGTAEDPIPAVRGMEYTYGLYYLDPENGKTYFCTTTGVIPGGTVVLQYLPHELIGHYFVEVS